MRYTQTQSINILAFIKCLTRAVCDATHVTEAIEAIAEHSYSVGAIEGIQILATSSGESRTPMVSLGNCKAELLKNVAIPRPDERSKIWGWLYLFGQAPLTDDASEIEAVADIAVNFIILALQRHDPGEKIWNDSLDPCCSGWFEFSADGLLITNTDGMILDANQAALSQLGCDREALLGTEIVSLAKVEGLIRLLAAIDRLHRHPLSSVKLSGVFLNGKDEEELILERVTPIGVDENVKGWRWLLRETWPIETACERERYLSRAIFNSRLFYAFVSPTGLLREANATAMNLGLCYRNGSQDGFGEDYPLWEFPCWQDTPQTRTQLYRAIAWAAKGDEIQLEVPTRDGSWLKLFLHPVFDDEERVEAIAIEGHPTCVPEGQILPDSPRIEAAETPIPSEDILAAIPDCLDLIDRQGRLIYTNRYDLGVQKVLNAELLERRCSELVEELLTSPHPKVSQRLLQQDRDNQIRYYQQLGIPLLDGNGRLDKIPIVERDTTEFQRQQQQLRAVLDTVPAFISWFDDRGRYLGINLHLAQMLKCSPEDIIGQDVGFSQRSEQFARFIRSFLASVEDSAEATIDLEVEGEMRSLWINARKYLGGKTAVAVSVDITARQKREREITHRLSLEQNSREIREIFLLAVSHNLRAPLTAILGAAELLEMNANPTATGIQKQLQRIRAGVDRQMKALNQLTHIIQAEQQFQPTRCDAIAFCEYLVAELNDCAGMKHHISFSYDRIGKVVLDLRLLELMLTNLLQNAIKYSVEASTILLKIEKVEESLQLTVKDRGIGIPPEQLDSIFQPFFRCWNSQKIAGTGLGLYIVNRCVELHGGQIEVDSQVGVGTTFTIVLPWHQEGSLLKK